MRGTKKGLSEHSKSLGSLTDAVGNIGEVTEGGVEEAAKIAKGRSERHACLEIRIDYKGG